MGRQTDFLKYSRLAFKIMIIENKRVAKCDHCRMVFANTTLERLTKHRNKCAPPEVSKENDGNEMSRPNNQLSSSGIKIDLTETDFDEPSPTTATTAAEKSSIPTYFSQKRLKMGSYVDTITDQQRLDIDMAIAKFFIGCNIAFQLIESPHFKNMIHVLRPAYTTSIPDRRTLATTLLDKLYNLFTSAAMSSTNNFVLLIDGWKNLVTNTKNVVTMLHNSSGERHFLNAWEISEEEESGDKLTEIVNISYKLAKDRYGAKIYAVVSDNGSNMIKMGQNVGHFLWHSTCNSDSGNLLAKDLINHWLATKVMDILKEFKSTCLETALLEKGGTKIQLPRLTNWRSYRKAYDWLITNITPMKEIICEEVVKVSSKTYKLFDDEFIGEVEMANKELASVSDLINACQSSTATIADAAEKWLKLEVDPKNLEIMEDRRNKVLNDFNLAAYYLHPNCEQDILSSSQRGKVMDFLLQSLDCDGIEDLDCFRERTGVFKCLFDKGVTKPLVFWNSAQWTHPNLSNLALKLFNIPASSTQIERVFSNWKLFQNPLQIGLNFNSSKKLIRSFFSLNACNVVIMEKLHDDVADEEECEP